MPEKPTLDAGRLNRRITIERPVLTQAEDGTTTTTWTPVATDIRAGIEPLSVRDFIAAHAGRADVAPKKKPAKKSAR